MHCPKFSELEGRVLSLQSNFVSIRCFGSSPPECMIEMQRTAQIAKEFQDRTHKDVFALAIIAMNCIISPSQASITPREFEKCIETACKQSELGNGVDPNWEYHQQKGMSELA